MATAVHNFSLAMATLRLNLEILRIHPLHLPNVDADVSVPIPTHSVSACLDAYNKLARELGGREHNMATFTAKYERVVTK